MVNANILLAPIAILYLNNNTSQFKKQNQTFTNLTNFYIINDLNGFALPVEIQPEKIKAETIYFPKCCPPEYIYEAEHHKCVLTNTSTEVYDDLGFHVSLIRSNLQDCEVVVDRWIQEFNVQNFMKNRNFVYDNEVFSYGNYCLDKLLNNNRYVARLCYPREYCNRDTKNRDEWCLRKCCADGYVLIGKNMCILNPELGLNIEKDFDIMERNDSIALFTDKRVCNNYPGRKSRHNFTIKANGNFVIKERSIWKEYKVNDLMYCMETYINIKKNSIYNVVRLCTVTTENDLKFQLVIPFLFISCVSIFITISVYIFVFKLKKIIQRIIVCYCVSLLVFYILLIIIISIPDLGKFCEFIGFSFFFSYISSFSWMNVMCFDIYRTVGSMKTILTQSRNAAIKKMAYYTTYALAVPSMMTLFLYMGIKKVYEMPLSIRPEFVAKKCVLYNSISNGIYGHIFYSVIPAGILIGMNAMFFIMTLRYYLKSKRDLQKISKVAFNGKDKKLQFSRKKIVIVLKLTLIMGISWIFEVIFLIINFRQTPTLQIIVSISDIINGLQGFFLFLIFLAKWKSIMCVISKLNLDKLFKKKVTNQTSVEATHSLMMTDVSTSQFV